MRASGTLAIANRVWPDGTSFTAEALREFARRDIRLGFDEESGELWFDGEFYDDDLSRLRETLRREAR